VDRLILLVITRWRMELRAMARSRARAMGLVLLLPGLLFSSLFAAFLAYAGVRAAGHDPATLLPVLSLVATGVGLSWMLAPLVTGVALTESHDVSRLLHFPVPVAVLVAASLAGNLLQPTVLASLPVAAAVAFALSRTPATLPFTFAGSLLSLLFLLSATQVSGLLLHGISRRRRFQDVAIFLVMGLGFVISIVPMILISGSALPALGVLRGLAGHDVAVLSPFAWGIRAAVHAGDGDVAGFVGWAAAQAAAIAGATGLSAALIQRIHRGELDLGRSAREGEAARARMVFPGAIGAQLEKDLRIAWRNPATKATLFLSCLTPLFWLFVFTRMRGGLSPWTFLALSTFVGASAFGNDFSHEGRGLGLLLGFPVERWRVLVAKNLGGLAFRLPGMATLILTGAVLGSAALLPAAATIAFCTFLIAAGVGNYVSILFPGAAARPGRNPYGGSASGARGLAAALLGMVFFTATLATAAPFVFLAWLPLLLESRWLWLASLPLALVGAVAVYAMLVAGAARLFRRREPDLLERVLEAEAEA
jgi:ABC-2 type transport system permease protein